MLALFNILLLLSPISQGTSEIGTNLEFGYSSENLTSNSSVFENYFYNSDANGIGSLNGINLYYNYFITSNIYLGIESNYLVYNSELIKTEKELININGEESEGEFEHVTELDSKRLLSALNIGYNLHKNLYFSFGLTYNNNISETSISSLEQISKPENAGVFIEEQSRIRDVRDTNIVDLSPVFGLMPSLILKYPMNSNNSLFLNGRVSYHHNLTSFNNDDIYWNSNSFLLNLGISYTLGNKTSLEKSREKDIESNVISFELIDRIERSTEVFNFDVIKYINLETGEASYANYSKGQSIILYVQLDNLDNKKVDFKLKTDEDSIFNKLLTEKLTKITIPKILVNTENRPDKIEAYLEINDRLIDQKNYYLQYIILHELSYIFSSDLTDLSSYIDINNERVLTIYTDDESMYKFLNSTKISNVTVRSFDELEFNLENINKDKYLLIIE